MNNGAAAASIERIERERDEAREALREAMLDCDHLILKWPSNPYEWQVGVRKMQDKIRAVLAKVSGTNTSNTTKEQT